MGVGGGGGGTGSRADARALSLRLGPRCQLRALLSDLSLSPPTLTRLPRPEETLQSGVPSHPLLTIQTLSLRSQLRRGGPVGGGAGGKDCAFQVKAGLARQKPPRLFLSEIQSGAESGCFTGRCC